MSKVIKCKFHVLHKYYWLVVYPRFLMATILSYFATKELYNQTAFVHINRKYIKRDLYRSSL
jgi:hypothetical protein